MLLHLLHNRKRTHNLVYILNWMIISNLNSYLCSKMEMISLLLLRYEFFFFHFGIASSAIIFLWIQFYSAWSLWNHLFLLLLPVVGSRLTSRQNIMTLDAFTVRRMNSIFPIYWKNILTRQMSRVHNFVPNKSVNQTDYINSWLLYLKWSGKEKGNKLRHHQSVI